MSGVAPRTDRIAESLFEHLCLDAGCAVNRSGDDQNGWDFLVEFPPPAHAGPPDTRPPALTCIVQIKSTQTSGKTVRIKLSNALKFAKNPLPCFTVLIQFAKDGKTATNYYLQHFTDPQIAQALKSGRQAHGKPTALNRITIPLRFTSAEQTPPDDLINRIARMVPGPATYGAAKAAYYEKVGYENGYGRGRFTFAKEHAEAFVDALLGKDTPVPVTRMFFHEERFGIVDPKAVFDGPGTIRFTPKPKTDCRVVVREPVSGEQIVLPGQVFTPGFAGLPEELRKIRIATEILEFTCGIGDGRNVKFGDFTASFGTKDPTDLDRLDQFAGLWAWFETGNLDLEVWLDGTRFLHGQIDAKTKDGKGYFRTLRRVTHALATFVDKNMRPPKMELSVADFADISTALDFIQIIEGVAVTVTMTTDLKTFPELKSYVTPIFLEFAGFVFFAIARYRVKSAVLQDHQATIELADPVISRRAVLPGTLADHAQFAREETAAVEAICGKAGEELVVCFVPEALAPPSSPLTCDGDGPKGG
jgi:hypothetical protein